MKYLKSSVTSTRVNLILRSHLNAEQISEIIERGAILDQGAEVERAIITEETRTIMRLPRSVADFEQMENDRTIETIKARY
jgi:hypothetical protein